MEQSRSEIQQRSPTQPPATGVRVDTTYFSIASRPTYGHPVGTPPPCRLHDVHGVGHVQAVGQQDHRLQLVPLLQARGTRQENVLEDSLVVEVGRLLVIIKKNMLSL